MSFDNDSSIGVVKMMLANDAICVGMAQESVTALSQKITELLPLIQEYAQQLPATDD